MYMYSIGTHAFRMTKTIIVLSLPLSLSPFLSLSLSPFPSLLPLSQDVEKPGELLSCIDRLKQVLVTPIKPYPPLSDEPSPPTSTSTNTANTSVEDKDSSKQVSSTPGINGNLGLL